MSSRHSDDVARYEAIKEHRPWIETPEQLESIRCLTRLLGNPSFWTKGIGFVRLDWWNGRDLTVCVKTSGGITN